MSTKLLWIGLTFMLAIPDLFPSFHVSKLVGAIFMIIGSIMLLVED